MSWLRRQFQQDKQNRDQVIVRASLTGVAVNLLLAATKAAIGLISGSIAIVLDAVNNLSDAASSIITIVGARLSTKAPDRDHPFGHGRAEYLSALVIAGLVLYAGITSLVESVRGILVPQAADYAPLSLALIALAVVAKILLGRYTRGVGQRVNSDSLVSSGTDALLDAVISAATLAAAAIYLLWGLSLEAYLAAVISVIIIRSGIGMLRETLSRILGESADAALSCKIKELVTSFPPVSGAYDLVLNNYGPDAYNGSVHIEVPDTMTAGELDQLIRQITLRVYEECHVLLTGVGIYSINTRDPRVIAIREEVRKIALSHEHVLEMHGFYLQEEPKQMRFDLLISFDEKDRPALYRHIVDEIGRLYPDYEVDAAMDTEFSKTEASKS